MTRSFILAAFTALCSVLTAQDTSENLPFKNIPEYPNTFNEGTVAARLVDALGFRFYWATEGLTKKDLDYKPNDDSRSTIETIDHIYGLSKIIVNSTLQKNNEQQKENLSYQELRQNTLKNLKKASDILRQSQDISQFTIKFGSTEYPFWNQINGPISDAIWHCGQIAINRRSSGNPINAKVNHFLGQVSN
ncbi:hypothetical protein J4050_05640 [Winogradskyella sp. DF17]|uniref:DinB family protein n=2 Tax=Winogradskyella pelagia TaxID=2819984 RepID=A0ABS3T0E4_9FLAO|nr:hypothetical protein [Winogradskyella sp. DF17]